MHETGIIKDLIDKILIEAKKQKAKKVVKVTVWLGALTDMKPDHFIEHFQIAALETIAANADIAFELSEDIHHPHSNCLLLKSVEIA